MRGRILGPFSAIICLILSHTNVLAADLPDLKPISLQIPSPLAAAPNSVVTITWGVTNRGATTAVVMYPSWFDAVYIISNGVPDSQAIFVAPLPFYGPVQQGGAYWGTNDFQLPLTQSGNYSLIFKADYANLLSESDETNNSLSVDFKFQVTPADLAPLALLVPTVVTGPPNPSVTIVWAVTNLGTGTAFGSWMDALFVSTNDTLEPQDIQVNNSYEQGPLAVGATYWRTNVVRLPITQSGTYHLGFQTDEFNWLFESSTNNNQALVPVEFHIVPSDLAPIAVEVPRTLTVPPNPIVQIDWGVTNQGPGAAIGFYYWFDSFFLSTNSVLDASARYLFGWQEAGPVDPGDVYWRTNQVQLPVVQSGTYYLFFSANYGSQLFEANTNDNILTVPITFNIQPPDLLPDLSLIPTNMTVPPNALVDLVWGVTNQGIGAALGGWSDVTYFSTNTTVEWWDPVSYAYDNGPLQPGGVFWHTNSLQIALTQSANSFLIFNLDTGSSLFELDKSNNVAVVPVYFNVQPADLAPIALKVPTVVTAAPLPSLTVTWAVTNQGPGSLLRNPSWSDTIYFSKSGLLDGSQAQLWWQYTNGPMNAHSSYPLTATLSLPVTQSGTYYLIFETDSFKQIAESDEINNRLVVPISFNILQPDLVPRTIQAPSQITGPPNPTVDVTLCVTNLGVGSALGQWYDLLYFSTDQTLDATDTLLAQVYQSTPLPGGAGYCFSSSVRVPVVKSGNYFLIFQTEAFNWVFESNTNNNILVKPVNFTIQPPDLAPLSFAFPNVVTSPPNPNLTFTWAITNQGIAPAVPYSSWADRIFISTNSTFDNSAAFVGEWQQTTSLVPGATYWQTNSFRVPVVQSGNYYVFLVADYYNSIYESDESNNIAAVPVTFFIQPPDLKPIGLQALGTLTGPPNPTFTIAWGVTNQGIGAAIPDIPWKDNLYLSTTNVFDYNAYLVASSSVGTAVNPGDSYWMTNSVTLPVRQSGTYYLFLKTDTDNSLFELDESNNQIMVPVAITILPPDLIPVALQILSSTDGAANPRVLLAWCVMNQGTGPALGYWTDQITSSKDPVPDYSETSVFNSYQYGPVAAGASYWQTNSVRVPVTESGTNYLILQVNNGSLFEPVLTNNTLAVPVVFKVHLPDLAPVALSVPNQLAGPPYPTATISWGITNQGTGPAIGWDYWSDQLWISTNAVLDFTATLLGNGDFSESGPISAGHAYWRSRTMPLPIMATGKYYVFLQANAPKTLPESNLSNNVASAVINFKMNPPDLAPIAFGAPTNLAASPNPTVTLFWGVTNQGIGSAQSTSSSWADQVYFSNDDQLDPSDTLLNVSYESGPVPPAGAYLRTNNVRLPVTQDGTYYLIFKADGTDILPESQESNNIAVVPVTYKVESPDLAPVAFQGPSSVTGSANHIVNLSWGVTNQGKGTVNVGQGWYDDIFLSSDPSGAGQLTLVGSFYQQQVLASGDSYQVTRSVTLPLNVSGDWYLVLKVNDNGYLPESDTGNNTLVIPFTSKISPPDLSPIALQVLSVEAGLYGNLVKLAWGVTNQGSGVALAAGQSWSDTLWLSSTSSVTGLSTFLGNWWESSPVPSGGSYWRTNNVVVQANQGEYYLIFTTNPGGLLGESILTNNSIAVKVSLDVKSPDLTPIALISPTDLTAAPYPRVQVIWGVTNQGPGFAIPGPYFSQWNDGLFLSTNATLDGFAQQVGFWPETNFIAPGQVYWRTNLLQLPLTQSGRYSLTFNANVYGLGESNWNNNFITVPLDFSVRFPDLAVVSWQAPTQIVGQPLPTLTFVACITNQGQGPASGSRTWQDSIYLSQTPFLDSQSRSVAWWPRSNTVPPGGIYWLTNNVQIPVVDSSDYFLFFVTDDSNNLGEQQLSNNVVTSSLSLDLAPPADLIVDVFQAPPFVIGTATPTISVVSHVLNQGWGPAIGTWSDSIRLGANGVAGYPGPTRNVLTNQESLTLLPGEGYWRTNTVQMPEMQSGQYRLTFWADVSATLFEADSDNNTAILNVDFNLTRPGPPTLGNGFMQPNGPFVVPVYGSFGNQLLFQVSTDLQNWQTLYPFYCTDTPTSLNDWQAAGATSRFYRVIAP